MNIVKSGYLYDGKPIDYEIVDNGYILYIDGNKWIHQKGYLPYKKNTLEESAIAHIIELINNYDLNNINNYDSEEFQGELNNILFDLKNIKESYIFRQTESPISTVDKLSLLLESIPVNIPTEIDKKTGKEKHFPKKLGYKWKPIYDGTRFTYELVEDPYAQGTETNPIEFVPGMEVYLMWFYTEGKHTYVCIKEGNPQKITDKEYFEKM